MSRRLGMACAAMLLFAAAGCTGDSFLWSFVGAGGKRQVVSGSVDQVSAHLKAGLGKVGVLVVVNPQTDGTIRLNGETKGHKRFALILKRSHTSAGDSTVVTVDWESDADEEFWLDVIAALAKPV